MYNAPTVEGLKFKAQGLDWYQSPAANRALSGQLFG